MANVFLIFIANRIISDILRANLEDVNVRASWIGKRDVFKFHQTVACLWSLAATSCVFGFPMYMFKNLLSGSNSLHEASVH